jgi:hypothetical protein
VALSRARKGKLSSQRISVKKSPTSALVFEFFAYFFKFLNSNGYGRHDQQKETNTLRPLFKSCFLILHIFFLHQIIIIRLAAAFHECTFDENQHSWNILVGTFIVTKVNGEIAMICL